MNPTIHRISELSVNPSIPGRKFLSNFRFDDSRIRKARFALPRESRSIAVELVSFSESQDLFLALCEIRNMGDRRFLNPYELLVFDESHPKYQLEGRVVTHEFTLGMDPDDVPSCLTRDHFGKMISDTNPLDRCIMPASTRYATTPFVTEVDKILLEENLGDYGFERALDRYLWMLSKAPLLLE